MGERTSIGVRFVDPANRLIFGARRGEAAADELQNALFHSVVVSHPSFRLMNQARKLFSQVALQPKTGQEEELDACLVPEQASPLSYLYYNQNMVCRSRGRS